MFCLRPHQVPDGVYESSEDSEKDRYLAWALTVAFLKSILILVFICLNPIPFVAIEIIQ